MAEEKIKAVLFDLGETLLNFGKVDTVALLRQGAQQSYDFLKNLNQPVGSFRLYFWQGLLSLRLHSMLSRLTGKDFDSFQVLKKILTRKGIELEPVQWQQLIWLWYKPLSQLAEVESNIAETLTRLAQKGLKLGIVSNTFINQYCLEKQLHQFGMLKFFDVRFYSYQFNFRKPDVRIFNAAAEKIGESVKNIMFVGDRLDNDIIPATKLGIKAVLKKAYTNVGKKIPEGVWEIDRLSELPDLIAEINAESAS